MSSMRSPIYLSLALALMLNSCSKSSSPEVKPPPIPSLVLYNNEVSLGQPLLAYVHGQLPGSAIRWSAASAITQWKSVKGDSVIFLFTNPGNMQISTSIAVDSVAVPYDTLNLPLKVDDTLFDGLSAYCGLAFTYPFVPDDHMNVYPISYSDSTGLVLVVCTRALYANMPGLLLTSNFLTSSKSYEIDIDSVGDYACCGTNLLEPATGNVFLPLSGPGNYPLVIHCNQKTFTGSLQVLDNACNFIWNDSSLVTVTPLTISKH